MTRLKLNDELLSAYLDAELPANEQARVEKALAADTKAQQRLEHLRYNDTLLQKVYSTLDEKPLPEGLVSQILAANDSGSTRVVRFDPRRRRVPGGMFWPASIAAALLVFLGMGYGVRTMSGPHYRHASQVLASHTIKTQNPLYAVLENTPAARTVALVEKTAITARPVMTLRLADGRLCREVRVSDPASVQTALACREGGTWTIRLRGKPGVASGSGGYRTASADSAFDAALDRLGAQAPLDAKEAAALMARGWKNRP